MVGRWLSWQRAPEFERWLGQSASGLGVLQDAARDSHGRNVGKMDKLSWGNRFSMAGELPDEVNHHIQRHRHIGGFYGFGGVVAEAILAPNE